MKHPTKIGSSWAGEKYIHGPRLVDPKKCVDFRLGKEMKDGSRWVWGQLKNGKWVRQSKLNLRQV